MRTTQRAHGGFVGAGQLAEPGVGEAGTLQLAQARSVERVDAFGRDLGFFGDDFFDLVEEPRIDERQVVDVFHAHAGAERVSDVEQTLRTRSLQLAAQGLQVVFVGQVQLGRVESDLAGFQATQGLLHRFLEGAAHRHHLAHRFHLGGQAGVGGGELLEGEARNLGDHVVDRRFERGRGQAAGDFVLQLVQGVTHGQLGGDLGDREAGGLGGQCRRTRHARVHFDHDDATRFRVDAELHVRTAGIHADLAQHGDGSIAQALVFLVGQGLCGSHGDRVTGVHAHRVQVFD